MAAASLVWAYATFASDPAMTSVEAVRAETGPPVPRIGFDRASGPRAEAKPASRDLFSYGRGDVSAYPTPVIVLQPTPFSIPTPEAEPTPTPWPVLNVVLMGVVELPGGRRGASFVKDGEIVLVGSAGAVLANAFRVVTVSAAAAEIEELGSGRVRRIPLKTN